MSRTFKDRGRHYKYGIRSEGHADFATMCRRMRRRIESDQLKRGIEPQAKQYDYYIW